MKGIDNESTTSANATRVYIIHKQKLRRNRVFENVRYTDSVGLEKGKTKQKTINKNSVRLV